MYIYLYGVIKNFLKDNLLFNKNFVTGDPMDAIEIIYRLKRAGLTQALLARDLGVSQAVVGNVIHDRISAYQVAEHIAKVLGEDINVVWPQRYTFKPRGRSAQRRAPQPVGSNESALRNQQEEPT